MQDKESGSLSQRSVLDLVVDLYRGSVTGSLKLDRAPLQKAIFFRDGQILFAHSNDPKDQLASILVEEGKLGPDQMQVAQGSVKAGNPLAKVLTDLGYISQRELADSARIKVEKILTDLYSWTEGSYQFVTKSLKVAIADLGLSSEQLIYTSICRVQDRDWVLQQLGSLEAVLAPNQDLDRLISEVGANEDAAAVLHQVDGRKTVKEICESSSLGEFDVCKIVAAALTLGALQPSDGAGASLDVSDDAFDIPAGIEIPTIPPPEIPQVPTLDVPPLAGLPIDPPETVGIESLGIDSLGLETVGIETMQSPEPSPSDTVFQPADNAPFTTEPPEAPFPPEPSNTPFAAESPDIPSEAEPPDSVYGEPEAEPFASADPFPPAFETGMNPGGSSSDLLLDESGGYDDEGSDEDEALSGRVTPRSKRSRRDGPSSGGLASILKIVAMMALGAGAAYAAYVFVWPMFGGTEAPASTAAAPSSESSQPEAAPASTAEAPQQAGATAVPGAPPPNASTATGQPGQAATSSRPQPAPPRTASPSSTPPPSSTATATTGTPQPAPPRPTPSPPPASSAGNGGSGRQLLSSGNLSAAATAFRSQLSTTAANKFTIAVGLYCSAENAGRLVESAGNAPELYVLPASVQGRSCFRIVWGTFDSQRAAESAIGSLPPGIRAGDSAAVPLARVLR